MASKGKDSRGTGLNGNRKESTPPIEVRSSSIHGHGVFATRPIRRGRRIIEYVGARMPWAAAEKTEGPHTFLFGLSDSNKVINAEIGGNDSRWINHSCEPNCEAIEEDGRVFIYALRDLQPGEELFYDYALVIDEQRTPEMEKEHECWCGAANCRRTLLARDTEAVPAA
jgi:SET domain-containing protein